MYIERFATQQQRAASNTAPAGISGQLPFALPGAFDRWPPTARAIADDTLEKIETGELDPDCFSPLRILLYVAGRGPAEELATAEALADDILGLDDGLITAEEPQPDQALAG